MPRNRRLPHHLETRRAGYYWRRRLPRSLRDRGAPSPHLSGKENTTGPKKSFLCFSLRSHVLRDAKILARRLTEMSDLVFAADAEMIMAIAPDTQVQRLESLARFEIESFERARAVAAPRSPEAAALDLRREEALQTTLRQAMYLGDRDVARRPLRHVAAHLGLGLEETDEDWTALAYEATKVLLDVSQERARRQQGIYEQPTLFFRVLPARGRRGRAGRSLASGRPGRGFDCSSRLRKQRDDRIDHSTCGTCPGTVHARGSHYGSDCHGHCSACSRTPAGRGHPE